MRQATGPANATSTASFQAGETTGPTSRWLGDSAMAGMVRAFDWSETSLGSIDRWPPALASAIGLCLHSRFQSAVYAGPELLFVYNDAERDILGQLHPGALGLPAHELLRDSWSDVGPELRSAMLDGRATWAVDRPLTFDLRGRKELIYFTYSYSPIFEADGRVSGVLLITHDTTARVLAERRLETLTEVTTRAMDARTERRACELAVAGLEGRPDVAFVLVYLAEGSSGRASCVAASPGMEAGRAGDMVASAQRVAFEDGEWAGPPLDLRKNGVVVDAREVLPPWGDPRSLAAKVFVGPIVRGAAEPPLGYMVAGLSEDRMFDRPYETFLGTLAVGIGRSVASARARQAERERARAIAALDEAKTALYSNASHELRTPLALILGHLEELRQETGLSFEGQEAVAVASRSALRMLKVVNALLEFSRIEAGEQVGAFRPTDVAQLTRDVASMFRSTAERAGLRLSVDCCSLSDPLHFDPEAWERIVSNLISNAIKFTPQGEISVRMAVDDDHLWLSVADTGIGIPDDDRERVFSRFYRSQRSGARTHEGFGIGLALVRELVRLHGGSVEASSRPGGGTLMTVRVPLEDSKRVGKVTTDESCVEVGGATREFVAEAEGWFDRRADAAAALSNGSRSAAITSSDPVAQRERIVLVEDNPDMREYLRRLLAPSYTVELARDGSEARTLVLRDPPAMVISDVMMPGLDGLALVRELRQRAATRNVPVILVSARADRDSMTAALEGGADDYIVKPFGARELLARVRATLENARARATAGVMQGRQTEREIKDAELRALLNDLKAAQLRGAVAADGERRKIEQNLHDGAQQQLMALQLRLQFLAESLHEPETVLRTKILGLQNDLDAALAELRELAHGVYPALLTDQGLHAAVAARARRQLGPVTVSGADIGRFRTEIENAVYYCCSEALQNVAKHAGAGAQADVDLRLAHGVLEFEVRDDGCGFDTHIQPRGSGRLNLRDRLEALGGSLDIDSQPGHGTKVHGRIPLF